MRDLFLCPQAGLPKTFGTSFFCLAKKGNEKQIRIFEKENQADNFF